MKNLNKTQAAVLEAAAGRRDHVLVSPEGLAKRTRMAFGTGLLKLGLVAEVQVKAKQPAWRTGQEGIRIGLVLTEAGLQAVRAQAGRLPDNAPADPAPEPAPSGQGSDPTSADTGDLGRRAPAGAPRDGTKQALVLDLLRRPTGASLDELVAATGWLPHTTRAALTGLRQRGFAVWRHKGEGGRSVYLITQASEAPASEAA